MTKKNSMREIIYEHNILNGFWFVLIEFILIAAVTTFISIAELSKGNVTWTIIYGGIAINAIGVCAMVIGQMRRGEKCYNLAKTYFGATGEVIKREHPNMTMHTLTMTIATLMPFLIVVLILIDR